MVAISNALLTSQTNKIRKTKCYPLEIVATSLFPSTKYDLYCDGVNMNAFAKPYGGNLGDPIVSDVTGQVKILFLFNIDYNQNYIQNATLNNSTLNKNKTIELHDPSGRVVYSYLPVLMKPSLTG